MSKQTTPPFRNKAASPTGRVDLEQACACANYMLGLCISERLSPRDMSSLLVNSAEDSLWGERFKQVFSTTAPAEFEVACMMLRSCSEQWNGATVHMGHLTAHYGDDGRIQLGGFIFSTPQLGAMQ